MNSNNTNGVEDDHETCIFFYLIYLEDFVAVRPHRLMKRVPVSLIYITAPIGTLTEGNIM